MSIEALIASTPKRTKSKSKSKSASPTLLAPDANWSKYFIEMNSEQIDILQRRIQKIYTISIEILQERERQKAQLWQAFRREQ